MSNPMLGPIPAVAHAVANTAGGTGVDKPVAGTEWAVIREVTRVADNKKSLVHFKTQALCDAWFAGTIDHALGVCVDVPIAPDLPALMYYFETVGEMQAWTAVNLADHR